MIPLVSVVIPTWNRGMLLKEAIISVLTQTEKSVEVLICDDGSTDNSRELVESLDDVRVRWLPGVREGRPAPARNRGIREARGEWIAFLDSDDRWHPEKLQRQLQTADLLKVKAVSSNASRFIPTTGSIAGPLLDYRKDRITLGDLVSCNWVICSSMLIHSSVLPRTAGFPEEQIFRAIEDYALWMRVASLTDIGYISEPLVQYRDDPATSIRGAGPLNACELRTRIFGNYLFWWMRSSRKQCLQSSRVAFLWFRAYFSSINRVIK